MKIKIADLNFTPMPAGSAGHGAGSLPFPIQVLHTNDQPLFPEECISLRKGETPDKVVSYMTQSGVWNTIQDEPDFLTARLSLSAYLIQEPQRFFDEPAKAILTPGLECPVSGKLLVEQRWQFRSSAEKHGIMNDMKRYIEEIPGAKGLAETAVIIADELFTNALFNAPFGDLESTLDRSTLVVLDPDMAAEIIVGSTEDRLFLGCLDLFGTINCDNLLERIYTGFNTGFNKSMNMEKGGAGIGILRMVDLASDIYVIVEKDKKTLVGCSFTLKRSPRKIRQTGKNFHFQSFQNTKSSSGAIRVERRGSRALFRISGDIKKDFPFGELDLAGVHEVDLDMRLIKQSDPGVLRVLIEILKNSPSLKKFYFGYVPYSILAEVSEMIEGSNAGEIRSVGLPFRCVSCKTSTIFFFVSCAKSAAEMVRPACSKCGKSLEPEGEIQKFIEI